MYIYKITNTINEKVYIGQTTSSIGNRWRQHLHSSSNCRLLKKAIDKYGAENFNISIVKKCKTKQELDSTEESCIVKYSSLSPNGYNLQTGGAAPRHSDLTKEKMSQTRKGRHPFWATEASRSEKSRVKRGNSLRGRKRPEDVIRKVREANMKNAKSIRDQYGNIYDSINEASRALGLSRANIQLQLRGLRKSVGGYTFKYT